MSDAIRSKATNDAFRAGYDAIDWGSSGPHKATRLPTLMELLSRLQDGEQFHILRYGEYLEGRFEGKRFASWIALRSP